MKKKIRQAINQGIKESDLCGYKWITTANGLKWEYCDVEFTFTLTEVDEESGFLKVSEKGNKEMWVGIIIGNDRYSDANTIEDAYRKATSATIKKANRLY